MDAYRHNTPGVELGSYKDLPFFKYYSYNALEWESMFTLVPKTEKNIDYIKKFFKRKLRRIKFPMKNSLEPYL